jgi:hypothetical protein
MIKIKKKRSYEFDCMKYLPTFQKIVLERDTFDKINKFCDELKEEKMKEGHYMIDDGQMIMRFRTGFTGEAVFNQFLGINSLDLSIGKSKDYNKDDLGLAGLKCGIKTAEMSKYHVVHKNPVRPEVLLIRENDLDFYICGLATLNMLKEYQDDGLILSHKLRARGVKTGFYGYKDLLKFNNYDELKALL